MTPNLTGPLESRLLALERRQARMDDDLRSLRRDGTALGQGIFDGWGDVTVPTGSQAPPPSGVTAFPAICASIPATLTMHDSVYGDFTLNWDGTSTWVGCKMVSWPGNLTCGAGGSTPVTFTLFGDNTTSSWFLQVAWKSHSVGGTICPLLTATCSTTPDQHCSDQQTFHCHGTSTWGRSCGNLYVSVVPTWTITIP